MKSSETRRRRDVAVMDNPAIELVATENGFLARPPGGADMGDCRSITTLAELVELVTEWAYAMHGEFPVMNTESPHAPVAMRAALEFLARQRAGRPQPPHGVPAAGPTIVNPVVPGNLGGVAHRVRHPGTFEPAPQC